MNLLNLLQNNSITYLLFALGMTVATLVVIPKNLYKKYLLYGLILGGLGEAISVTMATYLGLIRYYFLPPFSIFNIFSVWTPVTFMFVFSVFLYLMPVRKLYLIFYILGWTMLNYSVGLVLNQFGLFEYKGAGKFIAPIWFASWYILAAWIYMRTEQSINGVQKKSVQRFFFTPVTAKKQEKKE